MKTRILFVVIAILSFAVAGVLMMRSGGRSPQTRESAPAADSHSAAAHSHAARIPAYQDASQIDNLAPTLPANRFPGKTREAYRVAKEIPHTLAQLPCYCECDRAFGHKSLHSCFVDDHASQCAVCVDEALLAYKLQKEEKLTPEQVREKIIEKYSAAQ
ncbi:MAG: CYCXC family (seleno)protein [Acidobacteriota bacterium]